MIRLRIGATRLVRFAKATLAVRRGAPTKRRLGAASPLRTSFAKHSSGIAPRSCLSALGKRTKGARARAGRAHIRARALHCTGETPKTCDYVNFKEKSGFGNARVTKGSGAGAEPRRPRNSVSTAYSLRSKSFSGKHHQFLVMPRAAIVDVIPSKSMLCTHGFFTSKLIRCHNSTEVGILAFKVPTRLHHTL